MTSRGEYASALNCTTTKAMAKTMAVNAIMPELTDEKNAMADPTDMPCAYPGRYACSIRGNTRPAVTLATVYIIGITHRGTGLPLLLRTDIIGEAPPAVGAGADRPATAEEQCIAELR